jgi:uncharacterized protein
MTSLSVVAPDISVIIPALHEGRAIEHTLKRLAVVAGAVRYEVIVVDGDPQGSTLHYLPQDERITGILSQAGRGKQMNAGADLARGQILLFLHADVGLPPQALPKIMETFENTKAVAGAFDFCIDSPSWILKWISRGASLRTRLTRIPYGDQAIFITGQIFIELGGYPDVPILEDVDLMRRLKRRRLPIVLICDRVSVSARRWEQEGILFCTLRNWILLLLFYLGVSPDHLVRWYRPLSQPQEQVDHKI